LSEITRKKGQFQHYLSDLSGSDHLASEWRFLKLPAVEESEQKPQKKCRSKTVRNNILLRRLVHYKKPSKSEDIKIANGIRYTCFE